MSIKAVIFDLDGTLLNTLDDLADAMNTVLTRHRLPVHPVTDYCRFIGNGAAKLVTRAIPENLRTDEFIKQCYGDFITEYQRNWNHKTQPYTGIAPLLNQLQQQGIALAVLTNKPHAAALNCMEEFFTDWNFSIVLGQRQGIPVKPDPTAVGEILQHLDLQADQVIFIGDSDVDIKTGLNSQLHAVGASWGFRSRDELIGAGAMAVIDHPEELLSFIAKLE